VYPGSYTEYRESRSRTAKTEQGELKMQLELQKARVLGELSMVDRERNPGEYARLEGEYEAVLRGLQQINL
ncbi:MAG TPA: hypothetical protein VEC37_13290, partial [Bacillota bacterium]|nr:hypothetical protein [Bacillota bacterium]